MMAVPLWEVFGLETELNNITSKLTAAMNALGGETKHQNTIKSVIAAMSCYRQYVVREREKKECLGRKQVLILQGLDCSHSISTMLIPYHPSMIGG